MVAIQRQLKFPLAEIRALEWSVRVRVLRLYACTDVSPVLRNGLVKWRESNKVRERKGTRSKSSGPVRSLDDSYVCRHACSNK